MTGSRAHRVAAAAAFVLRHPKRAYRAIYHTVSPAPPSEPSDADRFELAMSILTGLDVSLTFERDGVVWTVPPGQDGIGEDLFRTGAYSGATMDAVRAFVALHRPGREWVVDVGANIGTTTIPFARAGFRVVAIEPVPAVLRYLRNNIEANGLGDRVRVLEGAVAPGSDVLIAMSTSLGSSEVVSTSSSTAGFEVRYGRAETIRVPALGLGQAVEAVGVSPESIALVWADTQGSETTVIETGTALWAAGVPLFAEFWPGGLASKGGAGAFIEQAKRHFGQFIDAANHGRLIVQALETGADCRAQPRPVAELADLAEEVAGYPGQFTDILLLPSS